MRQAASWILFGWLALTAGAYINGGDFHDSRDTFANRMTADGWAMSLAYDAPGEATGNEGITTLVARALQALPAERRGKVTVVEKREVARLAQEAVRDARLSGKEVIREGRTGALQYRVGAIDFETFWERVVKGRGQTRSHRRGLAPFVALKIRPPEGQKGGGEEKR